MSSEISTTKIDNLVATLDRPQLLAFLGVEDKLIQIGDNDAIRAISASIVCKSCGYLQIKQMYHFSEKFMLVVARELLCAASKMRQWTSHVFLKN